MTTSEKIITIANNTEKVFNAGYNKGLKENPPGGATEEELNAKYQEGYNAGFSIGWQDGSNSSRDVWYQNGLMDGREGGIEEGLGKAILTQEEFLADKPQTHYDAFWDAYQRNGNRTNYERAFSGEGWNDITFKPKYKINVVGSAYMTFSATHITEITRETVDFSKATKFTYTFYYPNRLERIEVDVSSATAISDLFYNTTIAADMDKYGNLADVKLFNINEKCTLTRLFPTPFHKLTNLFVSGVIGSDFDIKNLTLISKDNIINIINCLSTTTTGLTVTLSQTAVNNAFTTDEWNALIATRSNWTISLV